MDPKLLEQKTTTVAQHLQDRHGVGMETRPLGHPITGQFDGKSITLSADLCAETRLFVLAHLFGHIVQWNISDELREIGITRYGPHNTTPEILESIRSYEVDASRYGLALLHDAGIHDLDQWISDWSHADVKYLLHLYQSGEDPHPYEGFKERYLRPGAPKLSPLPLPPFELQQYEVRYAF